MAQVSLSASFETFRRCLFFHHTSLAIEPQAAHLSPPAEAMCTRFRDFEGRWLRADEVVLAGRVALARADRVLGREVKLTAAACRSVDLQDPTLQTLAIVFELGSPSEVTRPSGLGVDREARTVRLIASLIEKLPLTPVLQPLHDRVAPLRAAADDADRKRQTVVDAISARTELLQSGKLLKVEARTLFALDKAQLGVIFPNDRATVESFFLPADESKSAVTPDEPELDTDAD